MHDNKIDNTVIKFIVSVFILLIWVILFLIYKKAELFISTNNLLFKKYLVSAFIPIFILNFFLTILTVKSKTVKSISMIKKFSFREDIYLYSLIIIYSIVVSFFPNPNISLMYTVVGVTFIISFWSIVFKKTDQLLIFWLPIKLLLILIILDKIPPQGNWGRVTHLYKFPQKKPIIGEGGRLAPNLDIHLIGHDLPYPKKLITNSQGFRNSSNFKHLKRTDVLRILNIGDSHSIGYHLDQNSFIGPLLSMKLEAELSRHVEVLNAEVSNPTYGLYYIKNHGINFQPDMIILGLGGGEDFIQAYSLASDGAMFEIADGEIKINQNKKTSKNPIKKYQNYIYKRQIDVSNNKFLSSLSPQNKLNPYYSFIGLNNLMTVKQFKHSLGLSKIHRPRSYEYKKDINKINLIDGFPNLGFYLKESITPIDNIYNVNFNIFKVLKRISNEIGSKFALLYFPAPFEVISEEWTSLSINWNLDQNDFDLANHRNKISRFAEDNEILFIDPTSFLIDSQQNENLFIPKDAHFSELGHELISEFLFHALIDKVR